MEYLIDTDVCINLIRRDKETIKQISSIVDEKLFLSFMTVSELFYGSYNASRRDYQLEITKKFIRQFEVLVPDFKSCELFGMMKSSLRKEGNVIPDADLLIGSVAISRDKILMTNNTKHFVRLEEFGLRLNGK